MSRARVAQLWRAVLALAVLLSGCATRGDDSLVFTIEQALATQPQGADFASVVSGDWDRVCIFRAHTPYERVDSVIGAEWPEVRATEVETSADAALLAFVRGTRVVEHVMYPVRKGDFGTPGPEQWYCRPRSRAVFQLRHPIDGSIPWIGPVESPGHDTG